MGSPSRSQRGAPRRAVIAQAGRLDAYHIKWSEYRHEVNFRDLVTASIVSGKVYPAPCGGPLYRCLDDADPKDDHQRSDQQEEGPHRTLQWAVCNENGSEGRPEMTIYGYARVSTRIRTSRSRVRRSRELGRRIPVIRAARPQRGVSTQVSRSRITAGSGPPSPLSGNPAQGWFLVATVRRRSAPTSERPASSAVSSTSLQA